jgi:beta-glucanase (GH16 family)
MPALTRSSLVWLGSALSLFISACGAEPSGEGPSSGGALSSAGVAGGSSQGVGGALGASGVGGSAGSAAASTGGAGGLASMGGGGAGGASRGGSSGNAGSSNAGGSNTGGGNAGGTGGGNGSGANAGGGASDISVPPGYELVWHDEFDVDGAPNPANWKFEKGFARNEEAQWYQPDNAVVKDGMLVIEARKERVENPNYTGSGDWKTSREYAEYTSSSLMTSGLQSFQYGRFEMRGRIPTAAGMWPAWWTLGVSGEWPSNGEIDIMEFYQGKILANVACGTSTRWEAKWDSATKPLSSLGADWSSKFHVWRMDWDDQNIVIYLDDQQLNTSALSSMLNADGQSPFKQKAYLLVNLALGGVNGGDPSPTQFPQRYEVDYIRVFQEK